MRRGFLSVTGVALIAALGVVAGCSSSSKSSSTPETTAAPGGGTTVPAPSGPTVQVTVSDKAGISGPMTMVASPASMPAGDITFVVKNAGTIDHEVIVVKTNVAFDHIPVTDAGDPPAPVASGANKISETNNVGETGDPNLKPGDTRTFTIKNMTAGQYALVCNIADHYSKGMRAPFTVT